MAKILLFHKPYNVLSQFTDKSDRNTLSTYLKSPELKGFYPAGRLDRDSEGLLILTDDGPLQARISNPKFKLPKTYWVQVEGAIDQTALQTLRIGLELKDGVTAPAQANIIPEPNAQWSGCTPVRQRETIPTTWIELTITEGRNRQVRRMTAAAGFPTLRLIRSRIGPWALKDLQPGEHRWESVHLPQYSTKQQPNHSRRRRKH